MAEEQEISPVTYEELAQIEDEFDEIDSEIMRKQYALSKPAYTKRAAAISKIPTFWPLVLEQAPLEIDQFIQSQDSRIFAESLTNISVSRPELDAAPDTGNPKTLRVRFEFRANDDFADAALEKTFHWRRARDGWSGLVSEPVRIHWKPGKDLTEGLTDGAVALWEARRKAGDMKMRKGGEYDALREKVESWNGQNTSFFTWFGWVSGRRWVSEEESREAEREKKAGTKPAADDAQQEDDDDDDEAVEVHEAGEELAIAFAEELWPSAIKFFTQAQEMEEMSDVDFEEDDEMEDDDDEGEPVDIRALVAEQQGKTKGERQGEGAPPQKRQKK